MLRSLRLFKTFIEERKRKGGQIQCYLRVAESLCDSTLHL